MDSEVIARLKELESKATAGPWEWKETILNDRLAARLGKRREKLTKRDGVLLFSLKGAPIGCPDTPDGLRDQHDYKTVMELHWYSIRGDTVVNAHPGPVDRDLITELRTHAKALIRAAELSEARRKVCEAWQKLWHDAVIVDFQSGDRKRLDQAKSDLAALEAEGAGG